MSGEKPDASVGAMPSNGPVGKTMRANSEKFVACGRDSVSVQTGTTQHIKLGFTVAADGKVQNAKILEMSEGDPDLYSCVLRVLRKLGFPKPKDQKPKNITYPLVLRPE